MTVYGWFGELPFILKPKAMMPSPFSYASEHCMGYKYNLIHKRVVCIIGSKRLNKAKKAKHANMQQASHALQSLLTRYSLSLLLLPEIADICFSLDNDPIKLCLNIILNSYTKTWGGLLHLQQNSSGTSLCFCKSFAPA